MTFSGIVLGGSRKAAELGYPTANIPLPDGVVAGAYVSTAEVDGTTYRAVSYADAARGIVETHLFDFTGDLYGKRITVTLGNRIREPEAFENDEELARAIAGDADAARRYHDAA